MRIDKEIMLSKEVSITEEIVIEIEWDEIVNNLTDAEKEILKEYCFALYKDDYIEWLIDNGDVLEKE